MRDPLRCYSSVIAGKARPKFRKADLDGKILKAEEILKGCELCERACKANRFEGKLGYCNVPNQMLVTSMFDHWGEEGMLIPSFTVFFWSCTFSCAFCQNWSISQRVERGWEVSEQELAKAIESCSCKNVNFVGGEPTPYIPFILRTLKLVKKDLPVVWNSNFYMSRKSMKLLSGVVDLYLSDFKYGNDRCAKRLSGIDRYMEVVGRNHRIAFKDSDLLIRHLVLPGHFECCTKPVLDFVKREFGRGAIVNIMAQYRPEYKAREHPDINRPVGEGEFKRILEYADEIGLNYIK